MGALGIGPELAVGRGRVLLPPVFDFTGEALPAGATLVRTSTGTRIASGGQWSSAGTNVARFDHDRAGLARGLLVEPARINLCPNANANPADTSGVSAFGSGVLSVADDTAALAAAGLGALCGSGRAYKLDNSAAASNSSFAVTGALTATAAVGTAFLRGQGAAAIGFSSGGASMATTTLGTGYQRYASVISPSASGYLRIIVTAGSTVWIVLNQLENGSVESTPIVTAGAAATRAADVLTLDWGSRGVADGSMTARITADDGSTQDVALTVAGGRAVLPLPTRAWVRRVVRL